MRRNMGQRLRASFNLSLRSARRGGEIPSGLATRAGLLIFTLSLLGTLGCAPIDETPGLRLGGSVVGAPESFVSINDVEVIQLSAMGSLFPRVVNIWGVGTEDALYVWGDPASGWTMRVKARPNAVRVRIGDNVYKLQAEVVSDVAEKSSVVAAYQRKYGPALEQIFGRPATIEDFGLVYRLSARR